jgi:mannan polymerase II complex MNN11 subunit
LILYGVGALAGLYILSRLLFGSSEALPSGTPPVVLVTVFEDHGNSKDYIERIKRNRNEYAAKHGMLTTLD